MMFPLKASGGTGKNIVTFDTFDIDYDGKKEIVFIGQDNIDKRILTNLRYVR